MVSDPYAVLDNYRIDFLPCTPNFVKALVFRALRFRLHAQDLGSHRDLLCCVCNISACWTTMTIHMMVFYLLEFRRDHSASTRPLGAC